MGSLLLLAVLRVALFCLSEVQKLSAILLTWLPSLESAELKRARRIGAVSKALSCLGTWQDGLSKARRAARC